MNVEKMDSNNQPENGSKHDADVEFHIAFAWLTVLSMSIVALANLS